MQREVSRANGGLPSGHSDRPTGGGVGRGGFDPNLIKRCAVLATVNIARAASGGAYGNVDRCSARLTSWMQAGAEKRLSNRTKKLEKDKRLG